MIKKCENWRTKYKYCDCFLEQTNFKDNLIEYKCLCCNKIYQLSSKSERNGFLIHTRFLAMTIISFILLLQKGVYSQEYMNYWKNLMKYHYLKRKIFFNHLNMEDITDTDYEHAKRV